MPEHRVPQWHRWDAYSCLYRSLPYGWRWGKFSTAQRNLDQRDNDFYFIVTKNAERMGLPINKDDSTPERLVGYAHALCRDIPQKGIKAVVENNRAVAWASLPVAKDKQQQAADMFFRNALSTYCQRFSAVSEPWRRHHHPQPHKLSRRRAPTVCTRGFSRQLFIRASISKIIALSQETYVQKRARLFCSLLDQGEIVKPQTELSFGTIVLLEPKEKRSQLENIILQEGTDTYCIQHRNKIARSSSLSRFNL